MKDAIKFYEESRQARYSRPARKAACVDGSPRIKGRPPTAMFEDCFPHNRASKIKELVACANGKATNIS